MRCIKILLITAPLISLSMQAYAENSISVKIGSLSLNDTDQTIIGTNTNYESSTGITIFEIEADLKKDTAISGELIFYSPDYTESGLSGQADAFIMGVNYKKYFNKESKFAPFVAAGIGLGSVEMSGPIIGDAGGFSLQFAAGAVYRVNEKIDIRAEYKQILFDAEDDAGESVDMSGGAALIGAGFYF